MGGYREKLCLNYQKPFIKYNETPENPEEILKKSMKIDLESEDATIIDESRCQNTINTAKYFVIKHKWSERPK